MFGLVKNVYNYVSDMFTQFIDFIIENNLIGLFMIGVIGIALSQLISSIKINVFDYYLNKLFKTSNNNLINIFTSFLQFLIIIMILYFIYKNLIKPLNEKFQSNKFNEIGWKNDLLIELKSINNKILCKPKFTFKLL
jgi:large-conductance mechanosensitive channel